MTKADEMIDALVWHVNDLHAANRQAAEACVYEVRVPSGAPWEGQPARLEYHWRVGPHEGRGFDRESAVAAAAKLLGGGA